MKIKMIKNKNKLKVNITSIFNICYLIKKLLLIFNLHEYIN